MDALFCQLEAIPWATYDRFCLGGGACPLAVQWVPLSSVLKRNSGEQDNGHVAKACPLPGGLPATHVLQIL